ncbi:MAG TPA: class II aldolase/adducin family protein [Candidatus Binatia bacterium]
MGTKKKDSTQGLKERLVDGLKVLTGEGILTGAGHLSVRVPGTETFLINPRFPGVLATPKDICTVNFAGKRIAGKGPIPSETHIHSVIYRNRPDAGSVLHCHARYSILMGLQESGLIPIHREASLFSDGVPVFPNSKGINNEGLAELMVKALGEHYAAFLRGHGIVVVGPGIEGTCVSAISLERACEDQLLLMSFGVPKPLEEHRGRVTARLENPYRAWPYFLNKHKVKSPARIRASIKTLKEGEHY